MHRGHGADLVRLDDPPHGADGDLVAVGVLVVGIYLWLAIREQHFTGLLKQATPVVPLPSVVPVHPGKPGTIEEVLDELLAGKITRDEAAKRIRTLESVSTSS